MGLLDPVSSGIGQPASDASRISLLNMREPMDLQTTTLVKRSRRSAWKTDIQSSVVCRKISNLFKFNSVWDCWIWSGISWPPLISEHEKKLDRNHSWPPHPLSVKKTRGDVLGRHSKFSLVACCHLCGMTRLPGSYQRAIHSYFADIISEF